MREPPLDRASALHSFKPPWVLWGWTSLLRTLAGVGARAATWPGSRHVSRWPVCALSLQGQLGDVGCVQLRDWVAPPGWASPLGWGPHPPVAR